MPQYDYVCADCKIMITEQRKYEDRKDPIMCGECKKQMEYQFPLPQRYNEEPLDSETVAEYEAIERMQE